MEDRARDCNSTEIELIKLRLHTVYLISGLVIAIILLATGEWTPQTKFTEYLSNAATLVSVVLGLVAIFYSFVSNDSLSKSLGSITNVTDQIGKTREQMAVYVARTTETAEAASVGANYMKDATAEMRRNAQTIVSALEAMQAQTGSLKERLDQIPLRFDKIDGVLEISQKNFSNNAVSSDAPHLSIADALVAQYLEISSPYIKLLTHALVLSHQREIPLNLEDFTAAIGYDESSYAIGALMMADAIGLIDIERDEASEGKVYKITRIHDLLTTKTAEQIRKTPAGPTWKITTAEWETDVAAINKLFD